MADVADGGATQQVLLSVQYAVDRLPRFKVAYTEYPYPRARTSACETLAGNTRTVGRAIVTRVNYAQLEIGSTALWRSDPIT